MSYKNNKNLTNPRLRRFYSAEEKIFLTSRKEQGFVILFFY